MERAYTANNENDASLVALIERCRKDDRKAQKELFVMFAGKMMTMCRRYAQYEHEAEDLLQEGFIKVFINLGSFKNEGSFEGWVRRVFVHSILRNINSSTLRHDAHFPEDANDPAMPPLVIDKLSSEEIISYIGQLPLGYKTVFNLAIIEGYSHKEIASLLNIEEATSRSQLLKARKMLQKKIESSNEVSIKK